MVYCAVGVKPAVEPAARQFEKLYGAPVQIHYGPSGGLLAQIQLSGKGDLYIPAAEDPYLIRMRQDRVVREIVPLAQMRLVLAVSDKNKESLQSIADLLQSETRYAIANSQAAVGLRTKQCLERSDLWPQVRDEAKASLPTVNEVAEAVRLGVGVQAGIVWDATAVQYGLKVVDAPELDGAHATVSVGLLDAGRSPETARQFAQFLASSDGGAPHFRRAHYCDVASKPRE